MSKFGSLIATVNYSIRTKIPLNRGYLSQFGKIAYNIRMGISTGDTRAMRLVLYHAKAMEYLGFHNLATISFLNTKIR